jgi:hypothetical protein
MKHAGDLLKLETRVSGKKLKKRCETSRENALTWFTIREANKRSKLQYLV